MVWMAATGLSDQDPGVIDVLLQGLSECLLGSFDLTVRETQVYLFAQPECRPTAMSCSQFVVNRSQREIGCH